MVDDRGITEFPTDRREGESSEDETEDESNELPVRSGVDVPDQHASQGDRTFVPREIARESEDDQ